MRKKKAIIFLLLISLLFLSIGCDLLDLDDDQEDMEEVENKVSFGQAAQRIVNDFYSNMYQRDANAMGKDLADQVLFSREGTFLGNTHSYEYPQELTRQAIIDKYEDFLQRYDLRRSPSLGSFHTDYGSKPRVRINVTLELYDEEGNDGAGETLDEERFTARFYFAFEGGNWRIVEIDYRH